MKRVLCFLIVVLLLMILLLIAVNTGSLRVGYARLVEGLLHGADEETRAVIDLRLPRILIAMLSGAALAVSGVLFQACMRNPIADPGIIGVSAGASLVAVLVVSLLPGLYFFTPLLSFAGGILACVLVYVLAFRGGLNPLRVILVGVAVNAVFTGLADAFGSMTGGNLTGVASIVNAQIAQKTWDDVYILTGYAVLGLTLSVLSAGRCDLLSLSDETASGLGINVTRTRMVVSLIAVMLASIATTQAGVVPFVGLIVPHIARLLVGSSHRSLIPFAAFGGAFLMLLADTIGRTIAAPYEISPAVCFSICGGPVLILLLRRTGRTYGV